MLSNLRISYLFKPRLGSIVILIVVFKGFNTFTYERSRGRNKKKKRRMDMEINTSHANDSNSCLRVKDEERMRPQNEKKDMAS